MRPPALATRTDILPRVREPRAQRVAVLAKEVGGRRSGFFQRVCGHGRDKSEGSTHVAVLTVDSMLSAPHVAGTRSSPSPSHRHTAEATEMSRPRGPGRRSYSDFSVGSRGPSCDHPPQVPPLRADWQLTPCGPSSAPAYCAGDVRRTLVCPLTLLKGQAWRLGRSPSSA